MKRDRTHLNVLLRRDLSAFIHRCFVQLNPQTPYLPNWHIDVMAAKLDAVRRGEIRRLIINVPPRSLKSIAASIALPAWWLGHQPSAQILSVTYGQDLSDKLALDSRSVMSSPWYQRLFPTRLSAMKQTVQEFMTSANGFRLATSVGGVLTGRGADVIIIDDPLKPDEAVSDTQRQRVNDWYDGTLYSRLNNKEKGAIIIIMQRLHLDDLVGHVLEQEPWEVLSLPAIAEQDESYRIETPAGIRTHRRLTGEALHPEREPLERLALQRRTMGEYHFSGQYQQSPVPFGGGMVKAAWFASYEPSQLPEKFDMTVQSWDTASKESQLTDYSVCTSWGIKGKKIYLLHVLRKRMDYPDLKRAVRAQFDLYRPDAVLVEDMNSGVQLIQELRSEGIYGVHGIKPKGDKVMRMHAQTAIIENGMVVLPKDAPWLLDYVNELTSFPKAKYDDQVDSTSQALAWIKCGIWGNGMGLFLYFKQQNEEITAR
jgi:predicted phage terminase large subunit-like protein